MNEQRITPQQFDILQRAFLAELSVPEACRLAGITPPEPFESLTIVVDPKRDNDDDQP